MTSADTSRPVERNVRVFISSTFRDMHAERDHLVTVVFPQLRRLCESRGVTWGEVDLRWGVTDEAAAEGRVLPICLEEIQRCRPYFIGLLGERYGWVPDSVPSELLEKEPWLRDRFAERRSVTELEILHGVLRDPAMAQHAFFYFRDPAWLEHLPPGARRDDFVSEDAASADKLRQLKVLIRNSGLPVRENYQSPRALGALVLGDLTAVIDRLFPEGSEPDLLSREASDHAAYARSRTRAYIGRTSSFARLDAHADGDDNKPLVVLGESGSGKSALLANWAARYRQAHPDAFVIEHYIGATPASADWAAMLVRILVELKRRFGIEQELPDRLDTLQSAFPNWLRLAAARGRVILVLDALNQLDERGGAPDLAWLPPVTPGAVRVIVSTLPGRALDRATARGWPAMTVEPLSVDERRQLIAAFLQDYGRRLSPARVDRLAAAPPSANPLYLRVLLDELRLFGQHERLDERIDHYLQAASPYELYQRVIARWESSYGEGTNVVGDTLRHLWAARRGLAESELLDLLGDGDRPFPRAAWSPLFLAMDDGLLSRGGLLTFAHDYLRAAARDAYLPTGAEQAQAHTRLADYFQGRPPSERRTDELPWQLSKAQAWQRLADLLSDRLFFMDAWARNQFEIRTGWAEVAAGSTLRMVDFYRAQIEHPDAEPDKPYLEALGSLLDSMGQREAALRLRAGLVDHFRSAGDLEQLARALGGLAASLQRGGDPDGAFAHLVEMERICLALGRLDGLQVALGGKAIILGDRGDLEGAMAILKEKESVCRQLGDLGQLASGLGSQAAILLQQGKHEEAMTVLRDQERLSRQHGDLEGLCQALGNQAVLRLEHGELDEAAALFKQSESICRQLGYLDGLQAILERQAVVLKRRGDNAGAMALHKEAEALCRQTGNLDGLQATLGNQGVILSLAGDLNAGTALFAEQGRICRQLGKLLDLATSLGNQAVNLKAGGDLDGALALHQEQERIFRQSGSPGGIAASLAGQALILKARGDLNGAMTLHKEEERICRQLSDVEGLVRSLVNQALLLKRMGRAGEAVASAQEAQWLAATHGYRAAAEKAERALAFVRQRAGGAVDGRAGA